MKRWLPIFGLLSVLLFAQSCSKQSWAPNIPPVAGTWVLAESSQNNGYGWHSFSTGLESGVFDFYNNGQATYDDGYNLMRGSWLIQTVSTGYYDQYGDYYENLHDAMEIHLFDNQTKASADLYFDDVVFTGSQIIATNYQGAMISRYIFRRY